MSYVIANYRYHGQRIKASIVPLPYLFACKLKLLTGINVTCSLIYCNCRYNTKLFECLTVNVFHVQLNKDLTKIRRSKPLKLPLLPTPVQDTSNPFPMVTSKEVGWRSGRKEHGLEKYGRWGRPRYSIIKQLRWPNDAVP